MTQSTPTLGRERERAVGTAPTDARTDSRQDASRTLRSLPELLAPAGDWECAKAAVENGADAIYFGLEKFNARMRAHNFTEADLPKLMEFLHRRGVKGYVTFNTLVFANEMEDAERYLRSIISAGVDAAIVQDVGICRLIRRLSPDFPIHASTQMTITSATGVEFAKELGCNLVVLARECSIQEIGKIHDAHSAVFGVPPSGGTPAPPPEGGTPNRLPLEVFVHGALCVAYSGQCLTSEALGGRSANRGECAQACRMPYELISDGQVVPLGDRKYLLSPQDLAGLEVLPELVRAGVASLKIEGRLKSPEYVANITRVYRQALDRLRSSRREEAHPSESQISNSKSQITQSPASAPTRPHDSQYEMEMAFSRGLHTGWFRGIDNQQLVHARFGKKRGVLLGVVARIKGETVLVKLAESLKAGDGIVFDAGRPEEKEEGGRVYSIKVGTRSMSHLDVREPNVGTRWNASLPGSEEGKASALLREVALTFGKGAVDFSRVHIGDRIWKTSDPELDRELRQTFAGDAPRFQRPIDFEVHGCAGHPLTVIARDDLGHVAKAQSVMPLEQAQKQPLTTERLREHLGRLGGTPFELGTLQGDIEGAVILPMSELNRLRREVVCELETLRTRPKRWTTQWGLRSGISVLGNMGTPDPRPQTQASKLAVLVRSLAQLEAVMRCDVDALYCEFEDPKKYREAVALFRARQSSISVLKSQILVAPPRIFKTGEEWILEQVRSCDADGYLIRNYDQLKFFADGPRVGDFSLNVANALTADYFKNRFGLERVTASYDLNNVQLEALLKSAPPEWFEITIHQHIPMFHMEHCVFCAFLSDGTDFRNCGRPCDKHAVKLRDRVGAEHPLKADAGCRNTVFNALAQSGAEHVARLRALGARHFRIEFLNETPAQIAKTVSMYRQLLREEISGSQIWRELKLLNQLGVTRGPVS